MSYDYLGYHCSLKQIVVKRSSSPDASGLERHETPCRWSSLVGWVRYLGEIPDRRPTFPLTAPLLAAALFLLILKSVVPLTMEIKDKMSGKRSLTPNLEVAGVKVTLNSALAFQLLLIIHNPWIMTFKLASKTRTCWRNASGLLNRKLRRGV